VGLAQVDCASEAREGRTDVGSDQEQAMVTVVSSLASPVAAGAALLDQFPFPVPVSVDVVAECRRDYGWRQCVQWRHLGILTSPQATRERRGSVRGQLN
jgi:hypothetical protein